MKRLIFICFLLLLPAANLTGAQQDAVKSSGELNLYLDTASFRSSLKNIYQEFYYQISLDQLTFKQSGDQLVDSLSISISLTNENGNEIYNDIWTSPVIASAFQPINGIVLPDQIDLLTDPGNYTATLLITEKETGRSGKAKISFTAPHFLEDSFALSSIELASEVTKDTSNSKFTKNGLLLLPNAARTFGGPLPMLIYYFEIYNSFPLDLPGNYYTINFSILSTKGDTVRSFPQKKKEKQGETSVEVNAISTAGLSDSVYVLNIQVRDDLTKKVLQKQVTFKNIPIYKDIIFTSAVAAKINAFNEEELKLHIRQAKYILSKNEFNFIKQLDITAKKNALIEFWDRLDPNPASSSNEFWDNYLNRIKLANARFTSGFTQGWNTDQGRILIKYGVPDDIERNPVTSNSKPYQVWHYYREKGFRFIFMDEQGFNNYRLIYSSHEDEPSDPRYNELLNL